MAQGKVTEYFSNRKRGSSAIPSKRRKLEGHVHNVAEEKELICVEAKINNIRKELHNDVLEIYKKNIKIDPRPKLNVNTRRQTRATTRSNAGALLNNVADNSEETTAVCDDHHAPCTPSKQMKDNSGNKRIRRSKTERKDVLNTTDKTPTSYDFSQHVEKTELLKKIPARKRLMLHGILPASATKVCYSKLY